jgi:hypothetical protein
MSISFALELSISNINSGHHEAASPTLSLPTLDDRHPYHPTAKRPTLIFTLSWRSPRGQNHQH